MFNNTTVYMSHPILGSNGDMEGNCKKAISAVKRLRNVFPEVDFYCPAESDLVLRILYKKGKLPADSILEADLEILRNCHGWFFYKFDESKGALKEMCQAVDLNFHKCAKHGRLHCEFTFDIEKANYAYLRRTFTPIVEQSKKRFRSKK